MAFVDDQATHRVVQNWSEVAAEFALQRQVLRDWGMEPQLDKCGVMVRWAGRGAKELRSRPPTHVDLPDGGRLPVVLSYAYL
jgi:hypothetical protein